MREKKTMPFARYCLSILFFKFFCDFSVGNDHLGIFFLFRQPWKDFFFRCCCCLRFFVICCLFFVFVVARLFCDGLSFCCIFILFNYFCIPSYRKKKKGNVVFVVFFLCVVFIRICGSYFYRRKKLCWMEGRFVVLIPIRWWGRGVFFVHVTAVCVCVCAHFERRTFREISELLRSVSIYIYATFWPFDFFVLFLLSPPCLRLSIV